jgi:hypothetical protein
MGGWSVWGLLLLYYEGRVFRESAERMGEKCTRIGMRKNWEGPDF